MSHIFTMLSALQIFDSIVVSLQLCSACIWCLFPKHVVKYDVLVCPQCVCKGIFLGVGKQKIPAVVNAIAYYLIGLTLSLVFMFIVGLGVFGELPVSRSNHGVFAYNKII